MKRPELTKEIILIGINSLMLEYSSEFEDQNDEDYQDDLAKEYRSYDDGYELMKKLEDNCDWDASLDLANALDELSIYVDRAYKNHLEQWVKDNNIQPPYPIGHKFTNKGRPAQITEISKYDPYRYLVQYLDDGDCKLGGNSSRVLWFDEVGS